MSIRLRATLSSSSDARDPIAHFLSGTMGFTPITFGLFILVADLIVDTWLGWRYQVFLTTGPTPGILQDVSALVTDLIVNPLLCGTYLWTSRWAADLFRRLGENQFFESQIRVKNSEAMRQALYGDRRLFGLVLVLALIGTISQVGAYKGWFPWRTIEGVLYLHNGDMSFFRAPFWFITLHNAMYTIFNAAATVHVLHLLFQGQTLKLRLLHPDGCGGLGSFAEYASLGVVLITPLGILTSAAVIAATLKQTLATAYPVWILLAAYIILAPILLILPLYVIHKAMLHTKYTELQRIASVYDREYRQIAQAVLKTTQLENRTGDGEKKVGLERLNQIKQLYQTVQEEFPTWPLNVKIFRRYLATVVSPLLPALLSVLVDMGLSIVRGNLP